MDRNFVIEHKVLPQGKHNFEFSIDKNLFLSIEDSMISDGQLTAKIEMNKLSELLLLHCEITGTIKAVCDFCMEEFDYEVENCGGDLTVKIGGATEEENDDEIMIVDKDDSEFDISQWLYELICVSLPLRFEHPAGSCDKEARARVEKYIVNKDKNSRVDESKEVDPRWAKLLEISSNN